MVEPSDTVTIVARVVAAYVSNNRLAPQELIALIEAVHRTIVGLTTRADVVSEQPLKPAVPVKRSVNAEYIVCLEDGLKFKSLKRHLRSAYKLTPEQYRAKWGLPHDYPMVAPNYAARRSTLAKEIGLGRRRGRRR